VALLQGHPQWSPQAGAALVVPRSGGAVKEHREEHREPPQLRGWPAEDGSSGSPTASFSPASSRSSSDGGSSCPSASRGESLWDLPGRRLTDGPCLVVLLVALGGLAAASLYGALHGDIRRLYHGYNFLGEICGVGSQVSKPMLYWCRDASGAAGAGLDLAHPVCRERCPTGPGTDAACFSGAREGPKVIIDDLNSYTVQRTYTFQTVPDYNSSAFMGIACLPEDRALRMQVASQFQDGIASRVWLWVVSVRNAWPLILVAAAVATGLGFLNIAVLQRLAGPAVYCAAGVLCAAPLALGGGLLHGGLGGPGGGEADLLAGLDGWVSPEWRAAAGAGFVAVAMVWAALCCCFHRSIATAVAVVRASSDCFLDLPSLVLQPILAMLLQLSVFALLGCGLALLLSCGRVTPMSLEDYAVVEGLSGSEASGVFRLLKYHGYQVQLIGFYMFMVVWMSELVNATSQFVIAYTVQRWYFTPYERDMKKERIDRRPLTKAYSLGLSFHLGSLAMGSFVVASTRLLRLALSFAAKQAGPADGRGGRGPVACFTCALACIQRWVEFLNKNAYVDIAVNGSSFLSGARSAFSVLAHRMPEVGALNGACWVIQLTSAGAITASGIAVVYLILAHVAVFNQRDSDWYVQERVPVLVLAGLVSFLVGHAFMTIFDVVSDTILYCRCIEEVRRQEGELELDRQYAPKSLVTLIEQECPALRDSSGSDKQVFP